MISNSYALFQLRGFADQLGVKQFLIMMVIIWVISSALLYILHQLVPQVKTTTVGFSAVILGLTLVYYYTVTGELNFSSLNLLANILPHLFIPGISFWGHLSGILGGIAYVMITF